MKIKNVREKTSRLANSKVIATMLIVIVIGYAFFFLSGIIFPHNNNYHYTPTNEKISFDSRNVMIINSQYSQKQRLVEIQFDIENPTFDGKDLYLCQAVTKDNTPLNVTPVITESNFLVYHISVPKKFTEISIRIKVDDKAHTDILKIYTNADNIIHTDNITVKTSHQYKLERFQSNIELYNNQIAELNAKITESRKTINNIKSNNNQLKADLKYQTDSEILTTNNAIANNEQKIKEEQSKIKEYQNQIAELQEKIKKTEQRIAELN